ncbi:MAG: OmpA family protein [Burkholderiaceae bacterium]
MSTQNDESHGLVLGVVFGLIVLVIGLIFGLVLGRGAGNAAPAAVAQAAAMPPASAAVAMAAAAETAASDAARVQVQGEVVKFFFASGQAELAAGAPEALGVIVKGVAAGRKAVISGYHDATGDAASNEELAKQRALAVKSALQALGIGEDKIELRKPEVGTASGNNAEARRVEVTLE